MDTASCLCPPIQAIRQSYSPSRFSMLQCQILYVIGWYICFISGLKNQNYTIHNQQRTKKRINHALFWTVIQYDLWSPYDRKEPRYTKAQKRLSCPRLLCSPKIWGKVSWWWWQVFFQQLILSQGDLLFLGSSKPAVKLQKYSSWQDNFTLISRCY